MADQRARSKEAEQRAASIEPLAPGQDPLTAIDDDARAWIESGPDATTASVPRDSNLGSIALGATAGAITGAYVASRAPLLLGTTAAGRGATAATMLTFAAAGAGIAAWVGAAPTPDEAPDDAGSVPRPASAQSPHPAFTSLYDQPWLTPAGQQPR